jgi:hypothetical protein
MAEMASSEDEGSWLWALAAGAGALAADADLDDLWSTPDVSVPEEPEPEPIAVDDGTVRSAGLWPELRHSAVAEAGPEPAPNSHGGSIRHRPWGQVPGRGDPALRGLRMPEKARRPRS